MKPIEFQLMNNIHFVDTLPKDTLIVSFQFSKDQSMERYSLGDLVQMNLAQESTITFFAGISADFDSNVARKLGGIIGKYFLKHYFKSISLPYTSFKGVGNDSAVPFFEGFLLGIYQFDDYKSSKLDNEILIFLDKDFEKLRAQFEEKYKLAFSVNYARYLGQQPANIVNPQTLAEICDQLAQQFHLKLTILNEDDLKSMGAGGILSVGQGSQTGSRLIVLEYKGVNPDQTSIGLVGKAITFDTGGYSIKTLEGIKDMKFDKLGGTAVIGTLIAASLLHLPYRIIGVICAAENMISETAYRPDDIIRMLSGKTVEIITTDAEGRLVLADGITYLVDNYSPSIVIDLATLTGGIVTALGKIRAGLFCNDDQLASQLFRAGESCQEKLWRMPLDDEYFEFIRGKDADLKNSGGREGHPIMGGIFLKQFVPSTLPWAHIDIAGTATSNKAESIFPNGANGFGIRLLINFLNDLHSKPALN